MTPTLLASLLTSRICHDLVSPVTSLKTGMELLTDDMGLDMRDQAISLLGDGAASTEAKITFLRYAFGSIGLQQGQADLNEAKALTEGYFDTIKPSLDWTISATPLSYGLVRLMMNLALICGENMPRGGAVRLSAEAAGDEIVITAAGQGEGVALKPDTRAAMEKNQPAEGWSARNIQPYFARLLADELSAEIQMQESGDQVALVARVPASPN